MGKDKKKDKSAGATANNVYVLDREFAWVPAQVVEVNGDKARVNIATYSEEAKILSDGGKGAKSWREETVNLKHYPGKTLPLQNLNKAGNSLNEKEDMVDLPYLHEVSQQRSFHNTTLR